MKSTETAVRLLWKNIIRENETERLSLFYSTTTGTEVITISSEPKLTVDGDLLGVCVGEKVGLLGDDDD